MNEELLGAALKYFKMGFSIIPVGQDKKPLIQWKEFQERKPTEEEVKGWFSNLGVTGIGIVTGKISGIIVLDAEAGADISGLKIPKTPTVTTGGGGAHYWLKYDSKEKIANGVRVFPLIDIRGEGGYIIAPPSLHPTGKLYQWAEGFGIDEVRLASVPKWLTDKLQQEKIEPSDKDWSEILKGVVAGERNENAASVVGKLLAHLSPGQWESFAWPALKGWNLQNAPPLPESELRSVFESISKKEIENQAEEKSDQGISQVKKIISLVETEDILLFHDQRNKPYAAIEKDGIRIIKLTSQDFKTWLSSLAWKKMALAVNQNAISTAVNLLTGMAIFDGPCHQLNLRVARHEESIWYDLGDGSAVHITKEGWRIVKNPPVLFYRFNHQKPQVCPQGGGDIFKLLDFVNLKNAEEQLLFLIVIICCLIPDIPHPILVSHGPQGSAKSMLYRLLKDLIDPSQTPLLSPPNELREFIQMASHHWIINLDNLSHMSEWFSDALCKVCTGSGFSKRELFSDDEDVIYSFRHVVGINGINLVASKPDLLDRTVLLTHEAISESERKTEKDILDEYNKIKPFLLGAIFDTVVKTLKEEPNIKNTKSPRMADFAHWGRAAARALGKTEDNFLEAYRNNISEQHSEAIEASLIAIAIMELMKDRNIFEGTPTETLEELKSVAGRLKINTTHHSWPKNPNVVWKRIMEVKMNLQAKGIKAEKGKSGDRKITLIRLSEEAVQGAQPVHQEGENPSLSDTKDTKDSSLAVLNQCGMCGKSWKNDAYCPHSFDTQELWELRRKSPLGKIKLSSSMGREKIEFYDERDNFIGEYIEPTQG